MLRYKQGSFLMFNINACFENRLFPEILRNSENFKYCIFIN